MIHTMSEILLSHGVKPSEPFRLGDPVVFVDRKARKYLIVIKEDLRFNLRGGILTENDLVGVPPGTLILTSRKEPLRAYRPTLDEYVLLMPRGAQIIPPKDVAQIVLWGDIFPGAAVVEAGVGSGSMTLGLLRAVGSTGRVISYDLREDFINLARKNVRNWPERMEDRLEIRHGDIHAELGKHTEIDRVVLDLPDPWLALDGAARALHSGGFVVAYNPSIRSVDQLVNAIVDHHEFKDPEVVEVILRPWVADRVRLRPSLRITGHTGFLTRTRRRAPGEMTANEDPVTKQ